MGIPRYTVFKSHKLYILSHCTNIVYISHDYDWHVYVIYPHTQQ